MKRSISVGLALLLALCMLFGTAGAEETEEASTYGAPPLKLGESGTEEGFCNRIHVYEDKLDSKTKVWNKINNPVVGGDEYVVFQKEGNVLAQDAAGNVLYQGDDVGAAINSAVFDMKGGAGTVLLQAGDYEVKTTIHLSDHVTVWGIDRPYLKNISANPVISIPAGVCNTTLCNFIIDGNAEEVSTAAGIVAGNYTCYHTFTDLYVFNLNGDGIVFRGAESKHNVLQRCKVVDVRGAGLCFYESAGSSLVQDNYVLRTKFHTIIVSTGGGNMRIIDNTVVQSGYYIEQDKIQFAHGIALDGYGKVHGHNNLVQGNMVKDAGLAGIEVCDYQDDVIVTGNVVDGSGCAKAQDCYGIYFGGGLTESVNAIITNNTVKNTRGPGIRVSAPLDQPFCENVLIANNDIVNAGQDGILIQRANQVVISNNRILNSGVQIKGSNGIAVKGMEDMASDIIIVGNIATDTREKQRQDFGLFLLNGNRVLVRGNDFSGNGEDDWFELNCVDLFFAEE